MAFLQWRRFNFFDKHVLQDESLSEVKFEEKLKDVQISAVTCGRGQLILADFDGLLHFVDRQLEVTSFKAYGVRVTHCLQLKQHSTLITVGEDDVGCNPVIKVWNLEKLDRQGNPMCSRMLRALPSDNKPSPVTCISVHENMNYMAVGFESGCIMLFKGDVTRDRHSKQRCMKESGGGPITGLSFRSVQKSTVLYFTTPTSTSAFTFSPKDRESKFLSSEVNVKLVLDQHGCDQRCSVLSDASQDYQFLVARPEAVYFYTPDGRGPCLAFEGEKLLVQWVRGYLIIVSRETKAVPKTGSAGLLMNTVTVYDIQNKFIAYSAPMPDVVDIIYEWGSIYVLAGDRKLYHLQEKDTQTKLEMLFKKNMYTLAISLAESQQYDADGIIDIFRQYGDHLYGKGDHDGAIQQYIKTIGKLEASYVIRKFLDAQRIHNLTAYLQELHKAQLATEDHTTLLLNCYTKLKDTAKLDEFIFSKDSEMAFDVETAIKVCRSAGYYTHALRLAENSQKHDLYLKIQIEDHHDYVKALTYIGKLDFYEAESNMKLYGKKLVTEGPDQTTEFLKMLCTDYRPANKPLVDANMMAGQVANKVYANADEFIHIFVNNSKKLTEFLEHMVQVQTESSALVYNTLLELYLQNYVHETEISAKVNKERRTLELLQNPDAAYDMDQALVLCQMHNFKAGVLYLYEKAKLYEQILRYHMEHHEPIHIIETCKRFGTQDSGLWIRGLEYFAGKEEGARDQLLEVLKHIDRNNLLPPLSVVQTLSHSSTATLSVLKEYITKKIQQEDDQISEDDRLIQQYQSEIEEMKKEVEELKTDAKIIQASKCAACSYALDLPTVHFLCQHSYHQQCFESYAELDTELPECPACLPENRKIQDIIRAQEQSRDLHEQFHLQLERAQDPFSVVADYFGRRVFNKVTLVTEPVKRKPPPQPTNPFESSSGPPSLPVRSAPPSVPLRSSNPFESSMNPNNPRSSFETSVKTVPVPVSTNPFETKSTNPFGEGH